MAAIETYLQEIPEPAASGSHSSAQVSHGRTFVPQQQILLYSSAEWEEFTREWVYSQKPNYVKVLRYAGSGDMGIDIAAYCDQNGLQGEWDNFQCKHYVGPISPSDAALEVGKILWYSFKGQYKAPRKYYFIAPRDCGIKLNKFLSDTDLLKDYVIDNWVKYCLKKITETEEIKLESGFKTYVEDFDYSIFSTHSALEIIDEHRKTSWHSVRFGGGLPIRPPVDGPPAEPASNESRYIAQLFEAYSDYKKVPLTNQASLSGDTNLSEHYNRQREWFYHAEALRNFARDSVPPGTFEDLQNEVYSGVVDVESAGHPDAFTRLNAVTQGATSLQLTSNALITAIKVQDRKGICHQLANEDRLIWKKT